MRAFRAAGIAMALGLALACGGDGVSSDENGNPVVDNSMISLAGTVYASATTGVGCSPACSYGAPLFGAKVTTSLDGATATTDTAGRFTLVTTTRSATGCMSYTVTITAQGYTTYKVTGAWGNHADGKSFSMAPPLPTAVASC